jgi:glycosyltransferase involved in cell wall biosynthesis
VTGKVSVIIPVRDGERYLGEAVESVLGQTHPPLEVIVVDNGSTDRSRAVCEGFGGLVKLVDEPVASAARARNTGVRTAQGDFIAFLDADDLWDPKKLASQIEIFAANPAADLVFTHMQDFISPDIEEPQARQLSVRPGEYAGWHASTLLARAHSFQSVGPMPDVSMGEFIAWYGLAKNAGLHSCIISESLVRRRVHLTNMTRRKREDMGGYLKAAKIVLDSRRGGKRAQDT